MGVRTHHRLMMVLVLHPGHSLQQQSAQLSERDGEGGGGVERDGGVKERGERRGVGGEREIRTHARALSLSNTRTFARVLNPPPPPAPRFPYASSLSLSFCIMYKPVCPLETLFSSTKRDIDDSRETQKQLNHSHSCDLCKSCEWK